MSNPPLSLAFLTQGMNEHEFAFIQAAKSGHIDVIQRSPLVTNPYFVNEALLYAVYGHHASIVEYLVTKGADLHYHHEAALRFAAQSKDVYLAKWLIQQGADAKEAIRMSAMTGHLRAVQFLYEHELNLNDLVLLHTVLQAAAENGHFAITQYLFDHGANQINIPLRICL